MLLRQQPVAETRRALIEAKRDQLRNLAFDAELEVASLETQTAGVSSYERKKALMELEALAANRYAAAARMDELLSDVEQEIAAAKGGAA